MPDTPFYIHTCALRWPCARFRPHKMSGRCLACFRVGKCGCLRPLTPRVRACVLVAAEIPFSSTLPAAAVATLLRGWKLAQVLALLSLSNVPGRGIGS